MTVDGRCCFDTSLGRCGLAWRGDALTRLRLPPAEGEGGDAPPPWVAAVIARLRRYFCGEPVDFSDLAVDLGAAGEPQRRIYAAARGLGWGATATYGELAVRAGLPGAARAVGQAMARNPLPVVIPCHRVLASGGRLGGFSAPGGVDLKARLLAMEGMRLEHAPRLPGL